MKEKTTHISEQWRMVPYVGHYAPLVSAAWSPDSGRILTGSRDGTVRVWNTLNGAELMRLELHSKVLSVCWSPDGRYIAASSEKGPIEVWDSCSGKKIMSLDEKRPVASLDWSPNGVYLLAGFFDSAFCSHGELEETCAIVWDMQTGGKAFRLHTEGQEDLYSWGIQTNVSRFLTGGWRNSCFAAWSPDGARILTGHTAERSSFRGSRVAVIWDGQSGRYLLRLEGHVAGITSVAWSPDGRRVLTGSGDGSARVWDSAAGKELLRLEGHAKGISCVDWSADGARILTACSDGRDWTTRVWDCENGQEVLRVPKGAMTACWSPDGARILAGFWDGAARIFDGRTGCELLRLGGYALDMQYPCWSPSDRFLLAHSEWSPVVLVWDSLTGKESFRLTGHEKKVNGASWSPDGRRILTCSTDGTARVWDSGTGAQILRLGGHEDDMFGAYKSSWSPDGKLILTLKTSDNIILIWDAQTGRKKLSFVSPCDYCQNFYFIVWSPDGKRLLTAGNDRVARIWDVRTGREILCLEEHDEALFFEVAWSLDGTRVFTGGRGGCARIWDSRNGRKLSAFPGCVSWSPGGEKFLCSREDAFVIMDRTGREVSRYEASESIVLGIWSPDGGRVLTILKNSPAVIRDSASGRELARLENRDVSGIPVWSHNGEHIVGRVSIGGKELCRVWESGTGKECYRLYPYLDGWLTQYADGQYACDGIARVALMGEGPHVLPMDAEYEARWRIKE